MSATATLNPNQLDLERARLEREAMHKRLELERDRRAHQLSTSDQLKRYLAVKHAESALHGLAIGRRRIAGESDLAARQRQTPSTTTGEREAMRDRIAARRRDALDYAMSPEELAAACQHATLAARVRGADALDVAQALALQVLAASRGELPQRCALSASKLRMRAAAIHGRQLAKAKRVEDALSSAAQLDKWRETNRMACDVSGEWRADRRAARASGRSETEWSAFVSMRETSVHALALRLNLAPKQTQALAVAFDTYRMRKLTGAERVAKGSALAILRKRFATESALRIAWRDEGYSAWLMVERALELARRDVRRRSHLGGKRDPARTDTRTSSTSAEERKRALRTWSAPPSTRASSLGWITRTDDSAEHAEERDRYARLHYPDRMSYGNPSYSGAHPAMERERLARLDEEESNPA